MSRLSFDSTLAQLLDDGLALKLIDKYFPTVIGNPMLEFVKNYKVRDILPFLKGKVEQGKIDAFEAELVSIP